VHRSVICNENIGGLDVRIVPSQIRNPMFTPVSYIDKKKSIRNAKCTVTCCIRWWYWIIISTYFGQKL